MTLNLIVVGRAEQVHQGAEEASLDDGRLVCGVNGNVSYACDGGEDKGEVG